MVTPEGRVKVAVKAWLKAHGIWFCMPMGTGFGSSGVPDFICCSKGRFLAIETKAPGKRGATTALQDRHIKNIHAAGGAALVIDDVSQLDVLALGDASATVLMQDVSSALSKALSKTPNARQLARDAASAIANSKQGILL